MGGTTSPLTFPYPTGTDRVADGDNAIQALAERLNTYLNTIGATVPLDSNIGALDSNYVYKTGGMATLHLGLQNNIGWNAIWAVAFIPAGYRPIRNTAMVMSNPDTGAPNQLCIVRPDGQVMPVASWAIHTKVVGTLVYPVPPGT